MIYVLNPKLNFLKKIVSTRKNKNQQTKQRSQLNGPLNDFVIGSSTYVGIIENGTLESQTDGRYNNPERIADGEISASRSQVIGNNFDDKIGKTVGSAVKTVESRMRDATLTTRNIVVIPRVEMAVRPITGSSGPIVQSKTLLEGIS